MTRDEFERGYAERSNITIERLKEFGREARPCDCGDEICEGWQMAHVNDPDWCETHNRIDFHEKPVKADR